MARSGGEQFLATAKPMHFSVLGHRGDSDFVTFILPTTQAIGLSMAFWLPEQPLFVVQP